MYKCYARIPIVGAVNYCQESSCRHWIPCRKFRSTDFSKEQDQSNSAFLKIHRFHTFFFFFFLSGGRTLITQLQIPQRGEPLNGLPRGRFTSGEERRSRAGGNV